jgi:glycosyltransferase involved in cell wall biosynthesis
VAAGGHVVYVRAGWLKSLPEPRPRYPIHVSDPLPSPVLLMTRSLGHGGTERQVAELAKALDRNLFTPHIACFDRGGFREDELRQRGVPILQMEMHSFVSRESVRALLRLRSYVQAHGIRLAHTFDHPMNVFGVPAARLLRVPVVLSSQRSHRSLIPPKYLRAVRFSDRLVDGIVVNCNFVRDHLIDDYALPERKIHVCYNALDTERFQPGPRLRPVELAGAELVIGVICVLRAIKGLSTLMEAFARLYRPGLKLLIVGSGPERDSLAAQARSLGVSSGCLFKESTNDVAGWLRAIDIFVLPSLSEALSNSLMEAMAAGCCAVASRVGGNPELVRHGDTGLLFEAGNAAALAEELRTVVGNADLRSRLADAGSRFVASTLSTAQSVGRMQQIYTRFLTPGTRVPS